MLLVCLQLYLDRLMCAAQPLHTYTNMSRSLDYHNFVSVSFFRFTRARARSYVCVCVCATWSLVNQFSKWISMLLAAVVNGIDSLLPALYVRYAHNERMCVRVSCIQLKMNGNICPWCYTTGAISLYRLWGILHTLSVCSFLFAYSLSRMLLSWTPQSCMWLSNGCPWH